MPLFMSFAVAALLLSPVTANAIETPIRSCEELFLKSNRTSPRTHIDKAAFERWLDAHSQAPALIETVAWLAARIEIISREEIIEGALSSFREFLKKNPGMPIAFVVFEDPLFNGDLPLNKSGAWITGALIAAYPEFKNRPVFSSKSLDDDSLKQFSKLYPDMHYVIADDISYSGQQLGILASRVSNAIGKKKDHIHVVTSATSSRSRLEIQPHANLYSRRNIYLIEEMLNGEPHEKRTRIRKVIEAISRNQSGSSIMLQQTLTTADYRIADYVSFPDFIALGTVLELLPLGTEVQTDPDRYGTVVRIPFLRSGSAPYRTVPYFNLRRQRE